MAREIIASPSRDVSRSSAHVVFAGGRVVETDEICRVRKFWKRIIQEIPQHLNLQIAIGVILDRQDPSGWA